MTRRPVTRTFRAAAALAALFLASGIVVSGVRAAGRTTSSFGGTLITVGLLFVLVAVAVRRDGRR